MKIRKPSYHIVLVTHFQVNQKDNVSGTPYFPGSAFFPMYLRHYQDDQAQLQRQDIEKMMNVRT